MAELIIRDVSPNQISDISSQVDGRFGEAYNQFAEKHAEDGLVEAEKDMNNLLARADYDPMFYYSADPRDWRFEHAKYPGHKIGYGPPSWTIRRNMIQDAQINVDISRRVLAMVRATDRRKEEVAKAEASAENTINLLVGMLRTPDTDAQDEAAKAEVKRLNDLIAGRTRDNDLVDTL